MFKAIKDKYILLIKITEVVLTFIKEKAGF